MSTTWREEITEAFDTTGDYWSDVEAHTFINGEMDRVFDDGYGSAEGVPFTLWTTDRVYFPVVYDGAEWVGWTFRNPCSHATDHFGGQ